MNTLTTSAPPSHAALSALPVDIDSTSVPPLRNRIPASDAACRKLCRIRVAPTPATLHAYHRFKPRLVDEQITAALTSPWAHRAAWWAYTEASAGHPLRQRPRRVSLCLARGAMTHEQSIAPCYDRQWPHPSSLQSPGWSPRHVTPDSAPVRELRDHVSRFSPAPCWSVRVVFDLAQQVI